MGLFRGIGARKDHLTPFLGTTPIHVRKVLAGLFAPTGGIGARSGILYNGSTAALVTGDATYAYNVGLFHAYVSRSSSDGGTVYGNDGSVLIGATGVGSTVPIAPAAGLQRIDQIWTRHPTDTENADTSSEPLFGVASGVAVSSGPVPLGIPAGALEIGRNLMTSAATSTLSAGNTITQSALYTGLRGAPVPCRNQAERDALPLFDGQRADRLDLHLVERYNGAVWLGQPISVDYRNTAVTYNTNSTWTPMSALVAVLDSPGLITNNGGGVTIIIPGRYEVQATAYFSVASAPRGVGVSKNSTTFCDGMEQVTMPVNANVPITLSSPSVVYDCVAGDILRGMLYQQNVGINTWLANSLAFRAKRLT